MKKILSILLVAFFVVGLAGCNGTDVIPQEIIDCVINPDGDGCEDIIPDKTPGEILADLIKDNWDGDLTHLSILLENMDFDDSMEFSAEINLEVEVIEEGELVTHAMNGMLIDKYQYLETGTLMHRLMTINNDGETMYTEVVFEEVDTGVVVYINVTDIKAKLLEDNEESETILDALEVVGITEDWLMFRFDDTLANLIEIEVMKDLLYDTFFFDLQDEMDLEMSDDLLSGYGIDMGSIFQNLMDKDYDAVHLAIENIDYDSIFLDIDMMYLVPEIVELLEEYQVELDEVGFDTATRITLIQESGTKVLLDDLSPEDISNLFDIIDDSETIGGYIDLSDMYDAYVDEDLEHFIVMQHLNQPEYVYDLRVIEIFDFDTYKASMDLADFEELVWQLDINYLTPEILQTLEWDEWMLTDLGFDYLYYMEILEEDGTIGFLNMLTPEQLEILLSEFEYQTMYYMSDEVVFQELVDAYNAGEYDEFVVDYVLNSEELSMGLREIPGFDVDLFKITMDDLDYDAFKLEDIDVELLADAVYEGQAAFDTYLVDLALTAPETASILMSFSGTVLELEPYMMYVDDLNYAIDNISIFEEYVSLEYFLDKEIITMELEQTPDFEILTTITFNGDATPQLFADVMLDAYVFSNGFETLPEAQFLDCPTGEGCDIEEYLDTMKNLGELGNVEMEVLYNPLDQSKVDIAFDFTSLVNSLLAFDDENEVTINDLSVRLTLDENATVTIPTEVSNINDAAEQFAKASLNMMAYDIIEEALAYYEEDLSRFEMGDFTLDSYEEFLYVSLAFDAETSFITVGGTPESPTISCTLYWADGTEVFNQPISIDYLDGILDGELPTAAQYQFLIDGVNQENFSISKMIIVFLFPEVDEEQDYMVPKY